MIEPWLGLRTYSFEIGHFEDCGEGRSGSIGRMGAAARSAVTRRWYLREPPGKDFCEGRRCEMRRKQRRIEWGEVTI